MDFATSISNQLSASLSQIFRQGIDDKSNQKTKLDGECLHAVFTAVDHLGLDTVAELCKQKLDGKSENEILQSMSAINGSNGSEDSSCTMFWLHELTTVETLNVHNMLLNLKDKIPGAIKFYKKQGSTGETIELRTIGDFTIYIEKGQVRFSTLWHIFEGTKLLDSAQFLTLGKQCLNDSKLPLVSLPNAKLSEANFAGSMLENAKLQGADLSKANLNDTNLRGANLRGTNFEGATLDRVIISNAEIDQDTNFHNAHITLNLIPGRWEPQSLNYYFNHLSQEKSGCLLAFINNINEKCLNQQGVPQKVALMRQVIDSFEHCDVSCIHDALKDILLNNPIYAKDKKIADFILSLEGEEPKREEIPTSTKYLENRSFLDGVMKLDKDRRATYMLSVNHTFVHSIAQCTGPGSDKQIKDDAVALYYEYLDLHCVKLFEPNKKLKDYLYFERYKFIPDDMRAFVFYRYNEPTQTGEVALVSREELRKMTSFEDLRYGKYLQST